MKKIKCLKIVAITALLASSNVYAQKDNYEATCRSIYPEICKTSTSCYDEEKAKFDKLNEFCVSVIQPNNFLDVTLKKLSDMELKVISKENPEALKREFPELRNEVNEIEKQIVDGVKLLSSYLKQDEEITTKFNNKTAFFTKEMTISNSKSFLLYVMRDNNLVKYRDFFHNKIKTKDGEKGIADFKDEVLTKSECINLVFHSLKNYKLNEGVDAIREVTDLLEKQNIKCK